MKFRDPKTGRMFRAIRTARTWYCTMSKYKSCDQCPLFSEIGAGCILFCTDHPAEAARLMGYEVIESEEESEEESEDGVQICEEVKAKVKEVNMEKKYKPRLADVLGVKEDMEWTFPAIPGSVYRVHHGVRQRKRTDGYWEVCFSEEDLTYMVNHPESIIRTPRLTEAELAICKAVGAKWVTRNDTLCPDVYLWAEKPEKRDNVYSGEATNLAIVRDELFPSVGPGNCIEVEVTGGNGH